MERGRLLILGQLSREYLRRLTKIGAPYTLHYRPEERDRYGRLSGEVRDNKGRSLAEILVSGGYAIASRDGTEELRQLREYIEDREQAIRLRSGTVDMDSLLAALEDIRTGLSEEEFAEIERAMNEEYIEPLDTGE